MSRRRTPGDAAHRGPGDAETGRRGEKGTGSAGLPRGLRKTPQLFLCTAKEPQIPAKIGRGTVL
jgi:hypothetical protein